ncbi:MAG: TIGR03667 family PPOX class F420-dependent oxidoreductase [Actinomycetota bacterium]
MADLDERTEERLRGEIAVWLVTVSPQGQPQATPVWFLWDGETFLIYSQRGKPKLDNLAANPHVSLHLDGDRRGYDVVTVEGRAAVGADAPPADQVPEYVDKYRQEISALDWTPRSFAEDYSVPIRVTPTRWQAW